MANDLKRVPTVSVGRKTGKRSTRYPRYQWNVEHRPYQIQPVCCAPVAAGDSVRNIRFEARVLTDHLKSQISGWWSELYWFFVRVSDMDEHEELKQLVITPGYNLSALPADAKSAKGWTYHAGTYVDWTYLAMKPIIRTYFRGEAGEWNDHLVDGVPAAGLVGRTWLDALHDYSDITPPTSPATPGDYEGRWEIYEQLRKQKLVSMDFPEYLASQGIAVPDQLTQPLAEKRKPELLRYTRQFAYPANTVDPADGDVVSACSWVVAERMDRAIYCDEPGFIVGVSLVRPKVYRSGQLSTGNVYLRDGRSFLPDLFADAPQEVLDHWPSGGGAVNTTDAYMLDLSGLYTLGDQFVRGDGVPTVALPGSADSNVTYPTWQQTAALFATPGVWAGGVPTTQQPKDLIRVDGQAAMTITGRKVLGTITE